MTSSSASSEGKPPMPGRSEPSRAQPGLQEELTRLRASSADLAHRDLGPGRRTDEEREFRRAALNLMEDAERARQAERAENDERRRVEAELREANRRKDEFLAMLSHELRNPLAAIRASAYVLRTNEPGGSLPDIQREAAEIIERQVAHLTGLVNDLLDVSRIISGRFQIRMSRVDLREVIAHAVETVTPLFQQRRHILEVATPNLPVMVRGDSTRLEEVLNNLLVNAARYTPDDGRGRILVELEEASDAQHAVIRVRDNGKGIDESVLARGRIFELFVQGQRALDRREGGLGVGLTIVKRITELHNGTVEAISDGPGKGSEFVVRLPLAASVAVASESASPDLDQPTGADPRPHVARELKPVAPRAQARTAGPPLRILVVDDNQDYAAMLAVALGAQSHVVRTASSGPEGLAQAAAWGPDLVLLDIGLPEMDGYEVARRLRAAEGTRHLRLVAITGYGRFGDVQRARQAGFDDHLVKPIDPAELERLILETQTRTATTARPGAGPHGEKARAPLMPAAREARRGVLRVLCVDDSADVTSAMQRLIDSTADLRCVGCLASADDLVNEARRLQVDVVLLDATMPGMDPFVALQELAQQLPAVSTLIFSGHADSCMTERAAHAGARGCVSKDAPAETILRTIRSLADGSIAQEGS